MSHYCRECGHFRLLDALSYLCGACADTWTRARAEVAEAQEAA